MAIRCVIQRPCSCYSTSSSFDGYRQVIALLISGQPSLTFQISRNAFPDRSHESVELSGRHCIDSMKSQLPINRGQAFFIKQHARAAFIIMPPTLI